MKVLHLVLKYKWYALIDSCDKREEFRDYKWINRICSDSVKCKKLKCAPSCHLCLLKHPFVKTDYTHVCFHRGYSNETMIWSIASVMYGFGDICWGAPDDKRVIIIKLATRITPQKQ